MLRASRALLAVIGGLSMVLTACQTLPTEAPGPTGTLEVHAVAGPVCPVERQPPDPACEPRPVAGARIVVQPGDGRDVVVGQATTDEEGRASIELPAGDYVVVAGDVEGLLGRPQPARAAIVAGQRTELTLEYDTGIR